MKRRDLRTQRREYLADASKRDLSLVTVRTPKKWLHDVRKDFSEFGYRLAGTQRDASIEKWVICQGTNEKVDEADILIADTDLGENPYLFVKDDEMAVVSDVKEYPKVKKWLAEAGFLIEKSEFAFSAMIQEFVYMLHVRRQQQPFTN